MLNEVILEKRLTKLEKAVANIEDALENASNTDNWLQKLIGSISDEEVFLEALEYGRAFRKSDQPVYDNDQTR